MIPFLPSPRRFVTTATLFGAALSAALVYANSEPLVNAAAQRLDDDRSILRSDEAALAELPGIKSQLEALSTRQPNAAAPSVEAAFVRDLASLARRNAVTVLATTFEPKRPGEAPAPEAGLEALSGAVELRGTYRALLSAIGDLSRGSQIVRVAAPDLRRDGDAVAARVPFVLIRGSS